MVDKFDEFIYTYIYNFEVYVIFLCIVFVFARVETVLNEHVFCFCNLYVNILFETAIITQLENVVRSMILT